MTTNVTTMLWLNGLLTNPHSPAPWRVVDGKEIRSSTGGIVGYADDTTPGLGERTLADARLIAAAPDMCDAIIKALARLMHPNMTSQDFDEAVEFLCNALDKVGERT